MKKLLGFSSIFFVLFLLSLILSVNTSLAEERYSENLIPRMTSATTPSGKVTSSEQWGGGTFNWKAFDGIEQYSTAPEVYSAWGTTKTTGWLAYEFPTPKKIAKYSISYGAIIGTSEFGGQAKNWTFEGSNDGLVWSVLDTQSNVTVWVKNTPKSFVFENDKEYKFYRINVTANNGSSAQTVNLTIHELKMMEKIVEAPNSPTNLVATGSDTKIDLQWASFSDAASYTVKRSLTAGGPYTTIVSDVTDLTYVDHSVVNGTTYYYVVTALRNKIESPNSNEVSATPKKVVQPDPEPIGDRAILTITLVNGTEKEYDLPIAEVDAFLTWYDARDAGRGPGMYAIDKHTNNKGPFKKRKDYVVFDKILTYEVSEYTTE
ncbi:fibronectin type III domain-containing protein [Paenibacillus sp. BAC0078]